jgi:hypothetical protein
MTRTNINQIYKSALLVAVFTTLMGAILLFGQTHYFNPVVRATAIPQASNSYGERPMTW